MSKLLVEVCKVDSIEKHPNANRLSIVKIKEWSVVVGLDQYKPGSLVVFVPPDSIIPENIIEEYKLEYLKSDGRVKNVKLRGYISQGLILPIPQTPSKTNKAWKEGQEVSKELGITKYEHKLPKYQQFIKKTSFKHLWLKYIHKQITLRRLIFKSIGLIKDCFKPKKNPNPLFTKYTDISNYRHYNNVFEEGDLVTIKEKIHGSSFRAGYVPRWKNKWLHKRKNQEFCVGSHNVQLIGNRGKQCWYGEDIYGKIAEKYKLAEILPASYVLYGEVFGFGVQDLTYDLKEIDVRFFDIKYYGKYLNEKDFEFFCRDYGLPTVPVLYVGKFSKEIVNKLVNGQSKIAKHIREGIVIKSLVEENHSKIGRKILKYVSDDYLLRKNGTEHK